MTLAGTLLVLVLRVAADNLLHPDKLGRFLLVCVVRGGLVAAVLSLVVIRFLEDRRDDYFAALVEREYPNRRNTLINAPQLAQMARDSQAMLIPHTHSHSTPDPIAHSTPGPSQIHDPIPHAGSPPAMVHRRSRAPPRGARGDFSRRPAWPDFAHNRFGSSGFQRGEMPT